MHHYRAPPFHELVLSLGFGDVPWANIRGQLPVFAASDSAIEGNVEGA